MIFALIFWGCTLYPKVESFMSKQVDKAGLERRSVLVDGGSMYYWEGGNPAENLCCGYTVLVVTLCGRGLETSMILPTHTTS